jgi:hypothetical protein
MHTFKLPKYEWRAHHNGDFSGDIHLHNDVTNEEVKVPAGFLIKLIGYAIRNEVISFLEQLDIDKLGG